MCVALGVQDKFPMETIKYTISYRIVLYHIVSHGVLFLNLKKKTIQNLFTGSCDIFEMEYGLHYEKCDTWHVQPINLTK